MHAQRVAAHAGDEKTARVAGIRGDHQAMKRHSKSGRIVFLSAGMGGLQFGKTFRG
jgi:hypothetical protein